MSICQVLVRPLRGEQEASCYLSVPPGWVSGLGAVCQVLAVARWDRNRYRACGGLGRAQAAGATLLQHPGPDDPS